MWRQPFGRHAAGQMLLRTCSYFVRKYTRSFDRLVKTNEEVRGSAINERAYYVDPIDLYRSLRGNVDSLIDAHNARLF